MRRGHFHANNARLLGVLLLLKHSCLAIAIAMLKMWGSGAFSPPVLFQVLHNQQLRVGARRRQAGLLPAR